MKRDVVAIIAASLGQRIRVALIVAVSLAALPGARAVDIAKEERLTQARVLAASLCEAGEQVIANVRSHSRAASVCLVARTGLQYRFGSRGRIEIAIPSGAAGAVDSATPPTPGIAYKKASTGSDFASFLRFERGAYSYYVYTASVRGPADPRTGASTRSEPFGVVVMKGAVVVSRIRAGGVLPDWPPSFVPAGAARELRDDEDVDPFSLALAAR